jgi:hypothetical protein
MDRQYIDDHHVIARYLADRLSDAEREEFEAFYLEHPDVVKEMETVARFKAGLIELQRAGELDALIAGRPRSRNFRYLVAAAAIAAVAIGVSFFATRDSRLPSLLAGSPSLLVRRSEPPPAIGAIQRVFRTRTTGADAEIQLPAVRQALALEVLPESEGKSFGASLATARRVLATTSGLTANTDGLVAMYLDSSRLEPGSYELTLTNEATGEASVFTVRLRAAEQP